MTAVTALICFALWTLLLVLGLLFYRTALVFTGKTPANSWMRGTTRTDDAGIAVRAQHAHQNCVEMLPVFAAIVAAAHAMGKLPVVDAVGAFILYARLAQSITHLIGVSHWLVMIRATFFSVQALLLLYAGWRLLA
jgi:uncharacterized MAPEG superfamily protein